LIVSRNGPTDFIITPAAASEARVNGRMPAVTTDERDKPSQKFVQK
jgi:hypothetical protein